MARGPEPASDEEEAPPPARQPFATTALGPADVRDTPHSKPSIPEAEEPPPEDDPWIGRTLSNVYRVEARIGEGGMGAVYLARHVHLQKGFAVKVLSDAVVQKEHAVERLKQEAMAAAKIDHENIVDVVNFDRTPEGAVYIVMELLKGESLAECIGRGPIELHRALPITYQICRALHAAHEHDIVHRDLKPENIFLTEKGGRTLVKVLDFGISKIKSADAEQVRMTRTGQLVGTPLYMSPEQARGETEVDRRVDVYAMGVILYEMLAGVPPFEGRNYFELLWKHGNEPPPSMTERNPNVYIPEAVEDAVMRALAKDKNERFRAMAELELALVDAAPDVPALAQLPSLPPDGPRQSLPRTDSARPSRAAPARRVSSADVVLPTRRVWPIYAIAIAAVLGLGLGAYAIFAPPPSGPESARAPTPEPLAEPRPDEPPPERVDEPEPQAHVAPPLQHVALASTPSGARVSLGDRVIGTTPFTAELPRSDAELHLTFEMDGYLTQTISVVPEEGLTVPAVRLRRRRQADTSPNGQELPIKTGM